MGVVDVVLAADRKFLWGCAVAGRSLLDHASDPTAVRLTVVHGGLRPDEVAALRASWRGEGVPEARFILFPQERVAHLLRSKSVSYLSYARLLISDFLPADARRAVYIDTDVVFGCDVLELADLPLNSAHAGAVPNGDEDDTRIQFLRLGITADRYYNAGILLLDIEVWRSLGHTNRSLEIAASYGSRLHLHDQDALNVLLAGPRPKWSDASRSGASSKVNFGSPVCTT